MKISDLEGIASTVKQVLEVAPTGTVGTNPTVNNTINTKMAKPQPKPVIQRTGAGGSVTTVGGAEIARSTPKIGGMQTTSYADGSEKIATNTTTGSGVNISQTRVTDPTTGNTPVTNTSMSSGPFSANMDKNKGASASYQGFDSKGKPTSYNVKQSDPKNAKKELSRMQSNLNKNMSSTDPYKGTGGY